MPSRTMEVVTKGATRAKQSNVGAIPAKDPPKAHSFKVKEYEHIKYYELPESAIPHGWSNDPLFLTDALTAEELKHNYGFGSDISDTIAIVESDDGECRLMFEVQVGGQAHFYEWDPLTSCLYSVSGGDNINDFLIALEKGTEVVGPKLTFRSVKRNRAGLT